ncbi:MAG: hypothetical protein ACLU9S_11420 [Oscillospiraceae bacterium]
MIIHAEAPTICQNGRNKKEDFYAYTHDRSRFLAWLLLVAMVLTMLPTAAFAADAATYAKVDLTAAEDITAGQYLIYGTQHPSNRQRGHSRLYVYRPDPPVPGSCLPI